MSAVIRTAFTLPDRKRWTGGHQYFVNLFRVLHRYGSGRVRPVVFVGEDVDEEALEQVEPLLAETVIASHFSACNARRRLAASLLTGMDRIAATFYRQYQVRVVFESASYHGWRFPLPTVAWLPDFQHRLLPGIFGRAAWWRRELGFRAQIASSRAIMLSSESSRSECERFYPSSRGRTRVVPFAAELRPEATSVGTEDVRLKYDLPQQYIYLPNQFWEHKNHRIIVEALDILSKQGVSATVAASGALADYRRPRLLKDLEASVAELGLTRQFRFLGLVPRADVYALMRGAAAVANPSLCEGWSTAVEEARALGVPMLLSDIAVHREQAENATFFDPRSAKAAAMAIRSALDEKTPRETRLRSALGTPDNESRLRTYAQKMEELIAEVAR